MSNSIVKLCMKKGFTKVGHLINLDLKEWRSAEDVARQVDLRLRVVEHLISGLKASLSSFSVCRAIFRGWAYTSHFSQFMCVSWSLPRNQSGWEVVKV